MTSTNPIDEYIEEQNPVHKDNLCAVRDTIRKELPGVEERIFWSMPTWWRRHNLIHFAAVKKHIGIYPGPEAVVKRQEKGMSMEITTKRLILRAWEESDAADLFALASDPQIGPAAGWPPHKSVEDSLRIIRTVFRAPETYAVIRKEDKTLIGCAGFRMGMDSCSEKQDEPELGYWIGRAFWGQGYATEAGERLLRHAFEDLNSNAVWCCYYGGNARSKRVQEKLGFTYVRTVPKGETLLGYTLPEIENVLRKSDFAEKDKKR